MKQLLYFEFADIMALVEYVGVENMLTYSTHRELVVTERIVIDVALLQIIALKFGFYDSTPSAFFYAGVDRRLAKELEKFKRGDAMIRVNEDDMNAAIEEMLDPLNKGSLHKLLISSMKKS